ncbi:FG-GAP repeat-containing protein [Candidatus Magnetobacterium bavaricum]|uniref:FG-GAP repeat-containing protein n=1 Tax=Candidatus Magnetobacterium bavaricum TaxID=29290 RepID=A0A0F3GJ95_9BACT|nr:FG-GAP repeat-containing protein [Candidatus Magnetobacterium bavaricum]
MGICAKDWPCWSTEPGFKVFGETFMFCKIATKQGINDVFCGLCACPHRVTGVRVLLTLVLIAVIATMCFSNVAYAATVANDFNGDGKSDILLHNTNTGDIYMWFMNGFAIANGGFAVGNLASDWQIKAVSDFNGDGKSDILFHNTNTGDIYMYIMDGATIANWGPVFTGLPSDWQIKAVSDFNGDGKSDILFYNTNTGDISMWLMDGVAVTSSEFVTKGLPAEWQIRTASDFNGDGKSDILFYNTNTDAIYMWLMDGIAVTSSGFVTTGLPSNWLLRATSDFNGDGKGDILLQDDNTGAIYIWFMNGIAIASGGFAFNRSIDSEWQIKATSDFNGDGKSDVLFYRTNTGDIYIYLMNGITAANGGFVTTGLALQWQIK